VRLYSQLGLFAAPILLCLLCVQVGTGCLSTLQHDGNITCANFCPLTGARLLTTTQNEELRMYDLMGAACTEPAVIVKHPHRFYQHITVIKAAWHPVVEVRLLACM
jgi:hypothetical protein